MATGCHIELINHPDGNQFVARVWRTTQKEEITTTQKSEVTTQKDAFTTQKSEVTTQKDDFTTQKREVTTQKGEITTTQKAVLCYLKEHPQANRQEIAAALGDITEDGVKFNIGKLQQYGLLKREGGRKHGTWVVIHG